MSQAFWQKHKLNINFTSLYDVKRHIDHSISQWYLCDFNPSSLSLVKQREMTSYSEIIFFEYDFLLVVIEYSSFVVVSLYLRDYFYLTSQPTIRQRIRLFRFIWSFEGSKRIPNVGWNWKQFLFELTTFSRAS